MGHDPSIFHDSVPIEYICPQCKGVYCDPRAGPCGHVLCLSCWKHSDKNLSCPLCPHLSSFGDDSLIHEADLNKIICDLSTWCSYEGCSFHPPLHEREDHIRVCKNRNDIKKKTTVPEQNYTEIDLGDIDDGFRLEVRERRKMTRMRKFFIRFAISLVIYGIFAFFGLSPDQYLMDMNKRFCGVDDLPPMHEDVKKVLNMQV